MEVRSVDSIPKEEVTAYGSTHTTIQWLTTKDDEDKLPNFILRKFVIGKGGNIGVHKHWYEHGIFILSGRGYLIAEDGTKTPVKAGDTVLMPPWEPHGYLAAEDESLEFLCVIPHPKHEPST